jgi:hypothetical protein
MKAVESYLASIDAPWRRAGDGAWGVTLPDVAGGPLDVGLALRGPPPALLRLQAEVCGPGRLDPAALLHRNRALALVRFAQTRAGVVWVQADLPAAAAGAATLDATLGLLVSAAEAARVAAQGGGYAASAPDARRARSR